MSEEIEIGEGLVGRLRRLAAEGQQLDVAQFQFVGFDEIAAAYGDRWASHADRVQETAHAFIQRRLGEDDILVRGSDGFLIVYATTDSKAAQQHAANIKAGLNAFYLGEGATEPAAQVELAHRRLPVNELIETIGKLSFSTAPVKKAHDPLDGIDWKYQPVWDGRHEAIFNYYVAPVMADTGLRAPGYQFDMNLDLDRDHDFVAIDEMGLVTSEVAVRRLVRDGNRSLLGASVHSSSLLKLTARSRLLKVMDRFDPDLLRYRVVQISAVPPGFPRMYLEEIFNAIKLRVPNIAISLAWNEPDLRSVLRLQPSAIGFAVSPLMLRPRATVSQLELAGKVRTAVEIARSANCPFYFDGYADKALVAKLRAAGVDIISSPLVWPMQDAPSGVQRWASGQLAA